MSGYVDTLRSGEEEILSINELYVVLYFEFEPSVWGLSQGVDFGITKQEIIDNVKNQKYVEGASYFTMGNMFHATRMMMERMANGQ